VVDRAIEEAIECHKDELIQTFIKELRKRLWDLESDPL
jgi:hypothetical protein